jgi:hypothetical protein
LKPIKKKNRKDDAPPLQDDPRSHPSIPSKLMSQVIMEAPPEVCPWSLSGPQFPQPTAIQQRYCYPKGDPDYSSRKGGALWTMYLRDGREDLEFRLLHVYYSAKRAVNMGQKGGATGCNAPKRSPPKKKQKTGQRSHTSCTEALRLPLSPPHTRENGEESAGSSPLSFAIPPPSPFKVPAMARNDPSGDCGPSKFITPEKSCFADGFQPVRLLDGTGRDVPFPQTSIRPRGSGLFRKALGLSQGDARAVATRRGSMPPHSRGLPLPTFRAASSRDQIPPSQMMLSHPAHDPFSLDADPHLTFDMDGSSWPFDSPGKAPSLQLPEARDPVHHHHQGGGGHLTSLEQVQAFSAELHAIHERIKERVAQAHETDRGHLVTILSGWAKRVSQMPLSDTRIPSKDAAPPWPVQHSAQGAKGAFRGTGAARPGEGSDEDANIGAQVEV